MHHNVADYLNAWENFYIIVGSSAGALTGLQFVVIVLIAEVRPRSSGGEISAFGTPTVVHFCAVLLLGAILSAPWGALSNVAFALGVCGALPAMGQLEILLGTEFPRLSSLRHNAPRLACARRLTEDATKSE